MFPLPLHIYFEVGALLVSMLFSKRISASPIRWFLPYLSVIVIVELLGRYIKKDLGSVNSWLYNISIPIEYVFYSLLFIHFYTNPKFKKICIFALALFLIFIVINISFIEGFYDFNTYTLKIGSFLMIIFSCMFFIDLVQREKDFTLTTEPMFWIASGVLLFNTGEFFFNLSLDYLIKNFPISTVKIFASINNKLIWVLYTCIIIAILCTPKRRQRPLDR